MAKVLIAITHDGFRDEELEAVTKALLEAGHRFSIGSTHHTEARGRFGKLIKPDVSMSYVEPRDYDAIVFVGGNGLEEFVMDSSISRLVIQFHQDRKIVAAIGMAVEILIYAGLMSGKRATTDPLTMSKIQDAGGYFTGNRTEWDSNILTASGYLAAEEFAQELVNGLKFID